jgi:predicted nucleic acid-binding protein
MSVEPGIIDANVLVYAMAADAPQHAVSRGLLDAARDSSATLL